MTCDSFPEIFVTGSDGSRILQGSRLTWIHLGLVSSLPILDPPSSSQNPRFNVISCAIKEDDTVRLGSSCSYASCNTRNLVKMQPYHPRYCKLPSNYPGMTNGDKSAISVITRGQKMDRRHRRFLCVCRLDGKSAKNGKRRRLVLMG